MTAPPREKGNTLVRLATALVVAPVALLLIWIPALQVPLILFVTALVVQGLREYCGMTGPMGLPGLRRTDDGQMGGSLIEQGDQHHNRAPAKGKKAENRMEDEDRGQKERRPGTIHQRHDDL